MLYLKVMPVFLTMALGHVYALEFNVLRANVINVKTDNVGGYRLTYNFDDKCKGSDLVIDKKNNNKLIDITYSKDTSSSCSADIFLTVGKNTDLNINLKLGDVKLDKSINIKKDLKSFRAHVSMGTIRSSIPDLKIEKSFFSFSNKTAHNNKSAANLPVYSIKVGTGEIHF